MINRSFSGAKILPPGGDLPMPKGPNGRPLKRFCPCTQCQQWRAEREMAKMHKAMAEEFTKVIQANGSLVNLPTMPPKENTGFLL